MTEQSAAENTAAEENAAWATVSLPLPPAGLFHFLQDVERLFRLNPYLKIESWREEPGPFRPGKRYHLDCLNEMNGVRSELAVTLEDVTAGQGYSLRYDRGLKRATEVLLEEDGSGTRLTLKDHYHTPEGADREERLKEVDRSIVPWAASLHGYLLGLDRWSWLPPYRWYKNRVWLGMSPSHRRITRLIVWTTLLEFVVFLFVFAIYWLESQRA
jgi:hypothetical protein